MRRILYLGYYIKKLNWELYWEFLHYASDESNKSYPVLIIDSILSVFKYNVSLLEYFQFRFYTKDHDERSTYAGTGYMYEYQLEMNPKEYREQLEDKRIFLSKFSPFIMHKYADIENVKKKDNLALEVLNNASGKIVLKSHDGQCGWGVEVEKTDQFNLDTLKTRLESKGNNLIEEYIVQHADLMRLSPSGLNTIRIFTQLDANDEVELLGCRIRISVNSIVDNLAAGNIAAPVDDVSGIVTGPGVYSDITKNDAEVHPVTKVPIRGFQVPLWKETIEMVKKATKHYPECRSIGWDVAITNNGPELVEGNHDWCKLVWQLPVKKGLKQTLERHSSELKTKHT